VADDSIKPVYVLHGRDAFLLDSHRHRIVEQIIGDADPQVCVSTFDATVELAAILDELRTLPFLAPHRVVVIRDADAFVAANRRALEAYLAQPTRTASLLLLVASWPSNTNLYKRVKKIGVTIECSVKGRGELQSRLTEAVERRGKKINRDAAELLAQWVGENLAVLDGEIEKLSLYVEDRKTITAADVGAVVVASAGPAAFALTNALTAGDAGQALEALDGILNVRGEEFKVMGLIAWHLRRVLTAQQLHSRGGSPEKVLPYNMPPRQKQAFHALLRRREPKTLQKDFRRLIATDLAMKSGADPAAALQQLVVELCS